MVALTMRAIVPTRMSLRLLISQEEDVLAGAFALNVSALVRMSPF